MHYPELPKVTIYYRESVLNPISEIRSWNDNLGNCYLRSWEQNKLIEKLFPFSLPNVGYIVGCRGASQLHS